jgi:hypothetical protein
VAEGVLIPSEPEKDRRNNWKIAALSAFAALAVGAAGVGSSVWTARAQAAGAQAIQAAEKVNIDLAKFADSQAYPFAGSKEMTFVTGHYTGCQGDLDSFAKAVRPELT